MVCSLVKKDLNSKLVRFSLKFT